VPGMTIGGLLGRLVGQLAFQHDLIEGRQRGTFALIGTAAVLGGMTRMTLTLSVILAELTNDVALLPALMFTLAISRAVGDALNHSFDDMMIHIQGLPYLEEEVPQELEVLAARDVMSFPVVKLPEKVRVAQLLATLRQSPHNGFPIVGCKLETMHHVSGLILRQQLEVILELRLWGDRSGKETPLADDIRLRYTPLLYAAQWLHGTLHTSLPPPLFPGYHPSRYISAITMADTPMRIDPAYPNTRRGSLEVTAPVAANPNPNPNRTLPLPLILPLILPLTQVTALVTGLGSKLRRLSCAASAASGIVSGGVVDGMGGGPAVGGRDPKRDRDHAPPMRPDHVPPMRPDHAAPMRRGSSVCFGTGKEVSEAGFTAEELNAFVDLRGFMDPAPHTISELAPMASVYHMFNLMGVRHPPVFDPHPHPNPSPNPNPNPSA
jgi:hypothetical protein